MGDEAPMQHRHCFESVDRTFRFIRNDNRPFGGVSVIISGDSRQIPPVVSHGNRAKIVDSSFLSSFLFRLFHVFPLSINMRVRNANPNNQEEFASFASFITGKI